MDNPFEILGVDPGAGKREILAAAGRAMRERRIGLQRIAWAQKALLDPVSHAAHAFVHCIGTSPEPNRPGDRSPGTCPPGEAGDAPLARLALFERSE